MQIYRFILLLTYQQHPPLPFCFFYFLRFTEFNCSTVGPFVFSNDLPEPIYGPCGVAPAAPTPLRFECLVLISFVIVKNASSTFNVCLALVSRNGMLNEAANSLPSSVVTYLYISMSHLLPTKILQTPYTEYFSISWIHVLTFSKVSLSVTSYTIIIPYAPIQTSRKSITLQALNLRYP